MRRPLIAVLIIGLLGAVTTFGVNAPASASTPTFTVMNTSETLPDGVWFRRSPHTADTDRVTGHGVYKHERVQLRCYAWGDAVGPYHDRLWYYVHNVTRPKIAGRANDGYLNAHYINDGMAANEKDAGVVQCPVPIGKRVAYYSGKGSAGAPKARSLKADRVLTADGTYDGRWTPSTHCVPSSNAVSFAGKDINRLAGWSLGRLGPIYALKYLKDHNPNAAKRINYVIMFDPGAPADFGDCDYNRTTVQADSTLAWWLKLSGDNRLVILSGNYTATNHHQTIQTAYFPAIKKAGSTVRKRVLVCNYRLGHGAVYDTYAKWMTSSDRLKTTQGFSSCPKQGTSSVWGWNP